MVPEVATLGTAVFVSFVLDLAKCNFTWLAEPALVNHWRVSILFITKLLLFRTRFFGHRDGQSSCYPYLNFNSFEMGQEGGEPVHICTWFCSEKHTQICRVYSFLLFWVQRNNIFFSIDSRFLSIAFFIFSMF